MIETTEQTRYIDALRARVESVEGDVDVLAMSGGIVKLTVSDVDGDVRARILLSRAGKVAGAWDPDRLTDIIDGDLYGRER